MIAHLQFIIMELTLPLEIWFIIFNECDALSQIRLRQVCRCFNNLQIIDFYHIDKILCDKLNDRILQTYLHLKYLNAWNNENKTNVNHMTNLKISNASGYCGITDEGIKDLNLVELNAWNNRNIINVNHTVSIFHFKIYELISIHQNIKFLTFDKIVHGLS